MVEHGGELVADAAQIRVAVVKAVGGALVLDGVLPAEDVKRRDLRELLLAQVGKDLRLDHVRLVELGGVAQLLVHVLAVEVIEGVEGHVRRSLHLAKEVHLPCVGRLLGLEAALGLLAALPRPILVPALDVVGAANRVLANGHRCHRPCGSNARRSSQR